MFDRSRVADADGLERGGYSLWESSLRDMPEIVLIATGSEVAPTLQAGEALAAEGTGVRVVSMPCVELFEAQDAGYRDEVLGKGPLPRLAVEAGATLGWWKWVGEHGDVLGLDRFGASAPGADGAREARLQHREHRRARAGAARA